MTTIREAVDALKIDLQPHETLCIVIKRGDVYEQFNLTDVADREIGNDVFVSTGTFPVETNFKQKGSRASDKVLRVWAIPLDADIKDFLNLKPEDLWTLDDDELGWYRQSVQDALEETCRLIGWPIHRMDATGYGVAAYTYLPRHEQEAVPVAQDFHGRIVDRINKVWRDKLVDPGVRDAGSRIMRLVPCGNAKAVKAGGAIRKTETLYFNDITRVDTAILEQAAGPKFVDAARSIPRTGKTLPDEIVEAIVGACAPYWDMGQRHFMGNAVSGWLAKNGVPEEQTLAIVERLSVNDNKPWDRRKSVRDAYARYRSGLSVRGYQALADIMDNTELQAIDGMLEPYRNANVSTTTLRFDGKYLSGGEDVDDKHRPIEFDAYPEPPDSAFYGWFGDYVDLVHPTTEATKGFHLASALTVAGAISGRRVAVRYASERVFPNQYTLLVGPTGSSRKGTAMKRAYRLPQYFAGSDQPLHQPPFAYRRDMGSGPAVVKTLRETPNTLIVFEEATTLFSNIHRQGGESLLDRLIEAWDTPDFIQDNVKNNPDVAHNPYLSILAGIQPGRLEDALGANEIESGLANRMGIFFGVRRKIVPQAPRLDEALGNALYRQFFDNVMSYPAGAVLSMTDTANGIWHDWYHTYSSHKGSEDELSMRIRHPDMVQKWALLFAISDRASAVDAHHLEAAMAVLDWMWEGIKRRLPTWGVSTDNKIEALIIQALEQSPNPIKRRDLQRKTARRAWSGRDFAAVFRSMVENGHLLVDANGFVVLAERHERAMAEAMKEAA